MPSIRTHKGARAPHRHQAAVKVNPDEGRTSKMYGRRWQKVRLKILRAQPLCIECAKDGMVVEAKEVDHKTPHRGDMELFYDESNLQGLCKPCHSRKTAVENGGFGNRVKR